MNQWQCNWCREKFKSKDNYIKHLKYKRESAKREFDELGEFISEIDEELYLLRSEVK